MDSTYYEVGYSAESVLESAANLAVEGVVQPGDYFVYDYIEEGYFVPKFNIVEASADLNSEFSAVFAGGYLQETGASFTAEFVLTADPRELNIDTFVYTVPRESRTYTVGKEQRHYTVQAETRTWRVL